MLSAAELVIRNSTESSLGGDPHACHAGKQPLPTHLTCQSLSYTVVSACCTLCATRAVKRQGLANPPFHTILCSHPRFSCQMQVTYIVSDLSHNCHTSFGTLQRTTYRYHTLTHTLPSHSIFPHTPPIHSPPALATCANNT